jgi:hypothetical protein
MILTQLFETALKDKADLQAKRKALQDLSMNKDVDQKAVQQRKLDLEKEAKRKGLAESAEGLNIGDPVEITGNVEFNGATGEIAGFGQDNRFVIVNLYNHGQHSFHASDVSYNDYADAQDEEDDWYDDQEDTLEGWSDAMVARRTGQPRTPYSVYIKGKKWKDFENDDHAEAVANKLRAKFKAEGRDPGVITIAPTDMSEGVTDVADQVKKVFKDKSGKPVGEIGIDPESSPGNGEWYVHHYATGYSVVGFDSAAEAKRELLYVHKHPDAVDGHPSTKEQGVAEMDKSNTAKQIHDLNFDMLALLDAAKTAGPKEKAILKQKFQAAKQKRNELLGGTLADSPVGKLGEAPTDYQKRRQRERDVDAGRPVKAVPKNPQTDYARKRAEQRRQEELGEGDISQLEKDIADAPVEPIANMEEAKGLKKRVRIVKGSEAGKTGTVGEVRHGAFKGAPKTFTVDIDGGGSIQLPKEALRLLKDQGVAEETEKTATGLRYRAKPGVYGGAEREPDPLRTLDKPGTNKIEKALGIKFDREKKYQGGIALKEQSSPVENAILHRIMVAHPDVLAKYGPQAVMDAANDTADFVGDVDEIGSSDVSAWVKQTIQILDSNHQVDEVSKATLGRYVKLAGVDTADRASSSSYKSGAAGDKYNKADPSRQEQNRERGIDRAITRLTR